MNPQEPGKPRPSLTNPAISALIALATLGSPDQAQADPVPVSVNRINTLAYDPETNKFFPPEINFKKIMDEFYSAIGPGAKIAFFIRNFEKHLAKYPTLPEAFENYLTNSLENKSSEEKGEILMEYVQGLHAYMKLRTPAKLNPEFPKIK